jgi:hypothetical protein
MISENGVILHFVTTARAFLMSDSFAVSWCEALMVGRWMWNQGAGVHMMCALGTIMVWGSMSRDRRIYPPQVERSITIHSHQWMLRHAKLNTRWLDSTCWLRGMSSAWRNRDLVRKMTNFQVNQKQDQAGISQILHAKPFQRHVVRKLPVMVFIVFSLLLFPFYSSPFIISFSISLLYYFSPPSLFSIFSFSYLACCLLWYSSSSTSLIHFSCLLPCSQFLLLFTVLFLPHFVLLLNLLLSPRSSSI